jgi:hypothetical protein
LAYVPFGPPAKVPASGAVNMNAELLATLQPLPNGNITVLLLKQVWA